MPEQLLDAGVTWKVYNDPTGLALFNPLPYFKAYTEPTTVDGLQLQRQRPRAQLPGRLHRRRRRRHAAPGQLDPRPRHPVRAPGHRAAVGREPGPDRARHPHLEPRGVGPHAVHPQLRRERRLLRPRGAPVPPAGTAGEYLTMNPLPADGQRHRRTGRPRLPGARASSCRPSPGRLRGNRGLRPHLDPAPHRDALRRPGAQLVGVAPQRDRRHDERAWRSASRRRRPCRTLPDALAASNPWSTSRSSSTR